MVMFNSYVWFPEGKQNRTWFYFLAEKHTFQAQQEMSMNPFTSPRFAKWPIYWHQGLPWVVQTKHPWISLDDAATSYWILQEMERETNKDITKHDALVFDMNNNDNFTLSDSLWATFSYCSVHHSIFPNIRMNLSGGACLSLKNKWIVKYLEPQFSIQLQLQHLCLLLLSTSFKISWGVFAWSISSLPPKVVPHSWFNSFFSFNSLMFTVYVSFSFLILDISTQFYAYL